MLTLLNIFKSLMGEKVEYLSYDNVMKYGEHEKDRFFNGLKFDYYNETYVDRFL